MEVALSGADDDVGAVHGVEVELGDVLVFREVTYNVLAVLYQVEM